MKSGLFVVALVVGVLCTVAAAAHDPEERGSEHTFELSFGGSQLFDVDPVEVGSKDSIPTSSAIFLYEYFLSWDVHAVALFNLPLSTYKQIQEDGSIRERYAAPSLAIGAAWSGLGFDLKEDARIELQLGILGGVVVTGKGRYFPLGSIRMAIRRRDGFGLYLGVAGAFRVDTTALLYGVAHRF